MHDHANTTHARASHLDGLEIAPNATPGHRILPMEPVGRAAQAGFRRFTPAPAKTAVRFRRFSELLELRVAASDVRILKRFLIPIEAGKY